MKAITVFTALGLGALVGAGARAVSEDGTDTGEHPVQKVIGMLKDLKAQAIEERKAEEVDYAKFEYWCSLETEEVSASITHEKETIEVLDDDISGRVKTEDALKKRIGKLETEIGEKEASAKSAKDERGEENKLYKMSDEDYTSTIEAVTAALQALGDAKGDQKKAEEEAKGEEEGEEEAPKEAEAKLLQEKAQRHVKNVISFVSLSTIATDGELQLLEDFAGMQGEPEEEKPEGEAEEAKGKEGEKGEAEEADADKKAEGKKVDSKHKMKHVKKYENKSGGVVELLKQLKHKFEDEKIANTKSETHALREYELSKKARDDSKEMAEKSVETKSSSLSIAESEEAAARSEEKDEEESLESDTTRKEDIVDGCNTKKIEWKERTEMRRLELEAMDAAVGILGKATGVRTETPDNPMMPTSPVDFLQVILEPSSDPKMKAVSLLRAAAKEDHSKALERLASEVSNHLTGPFDKVNQMVQKMIFQLMEEQKDEDEHKLWCDKELQKTNDMKDTKEDKQAKLNAAIKAEDGKISKLSEALVNIDAAMKDIAAFMKESTEIRQSNHQENDLAIKDSEAAQNAVSNAVAVLKQFYDHAANSAKELPEVKLPEESPKMWDSSYTGAADPKSMPGGIITVLETINKDFSEVEADTRSQEQVDNMKFEKTMKANTIEKARLAKESEMKDAEKARRVEKRTMLMSQLKSTEDELEKTNKYLTDLQPACVNGDSSYEERKETRAKELASLKTAQGILEDAFKGGKKEEGEEKEEEEAKAASFLQVRPKRHL